MAQKKGKNKFGITPSMIFLNLLLVLIICTVCFFTYNIINGEDNTSSEPPFTAVTSEPPETSAPATTAGSTKKPDSNSSVATSDNEPTLDFDKDYFSSSLFIGDSISTGLSLYGFLDQQNVFAQQGLAPSTALDADIDGVTLSDKIASFKPKKILQGPHFDRPPDTFGIGIGRLQRFASGLRFQGDVESRSREGAARRNQPPGRGTAICWYGCWCSPIA